MSGHEVQWGDLSQFGTERIDLLPFTQISSYLAGFDHLDLVILGDVFWSTGQNICRWCSENQVKTLFLQHGQWIYVVNKKRLSYYPSYTALFGENVAKECKSWYFGQFSQIEVTGCPRYDFLHLCQVSSKKEYIFFSPPVIQETVHGQAKPIRKTFLQSLKRIAGFDKQCRVVLQPHYREANVGILKELFPSAEFRSAKEKTLNLVSKADIAIGINFSYAIEKAKGLEECLNKEVQIRTPEKQILIVTKSTSNFTWRGDVLMCRLPVAITYGVRLRYETNLGWGEWSSWQDFVCKRKMTL